MVGFADIAQSTARDFYASYRAAGGHNGHFDIGADGDNGWTTWGQQLSAMSNDLAENIK
jgi:S-formylglutathione hydrolase FrmB